MTVNTIASTLKTERLLLRPFEPSDFEAYAAIRSDPEVVRYLRGGTEAAARGEEIAAETLAVFARSWDEDGYGPWAAVDIASGRLIGHLGVRRLSELNGETEILYTLAREAWGRGLASEGAAAARDHAFDALGLNRVVGLALPENKASIRVLEKTGLRFERRLDFHGYDVAYMALDR